VDRTYAIGDIHGQLDLLVAAHRLVAADRRRTGDDAAPLVHLGDLVDRGPESAEVVEYLLMGPAGGAPWVTLKGNHDHMFLMFLGDPAAHDPGLRRDYSWLHARLGGRATLRSYGVDADGRRPLDDLWREAQARVPAQHKAFLDGLPLMHRAGGAAFVHAGVRPGVPLDAQAPQDLMWIRRGFLDDGRDHGALIVHGHTVVDQPSHFGNRVDLDTGAAYGGPLTAAVVEGRDVWVLTEKGRLPLLPGANPR
jgi:serine/threonine protein phosphatase 1